MLKQHVENFSMCWKLWCMLKAMSKFKGVLKMFMLGVLKIILKRVLKYNKNTITLYGTCWNWAADFIFLLRFCTSNWSETYIFRACSFLLLLISLHYLALALKLPVYIIVSRLSKSSMRSCNSGHRVGLGWCFKVKALHEKFQIWGGGEFWGA